MTDKSARGIIRAEVWDAVGTIDGERSEHITGRILAALEAGGFAVVPKKCLIPLTNGGVTLVSEEDVDRVIAPGNWFSVKKSSGSYACRDFGRGSHVYLHRFILNAADGLVVDHINGDTLDNRRGNLRVVSQSANQRNRSGAQSNSKSGIRGVYFHKQRHKWAAQIRHAGRKISLGLFSTSIEAEAARKAAEQGLWGWQDRYRAMLAASNPKEEGR